MALVDGPRWLPRLGWLAVAALVAYFVWGLDRRARLEAPTEEIIRLLFVPSVEQGTLVQRADELARFLQEDAGLVLRTEVPTSYAAVIQALGSGQADIAWMPAFAYVIANQRYDAQAKLQVVRTADRKGIVVTRSAAGEPQSLEALSGRAIAVPAGLSSELGRMVRRVLDERAPGWTEVEAKSDRDAVRKLVARPPEADGAVSSHVFSGPNDFVGDGRKQLEYDRPGTLASTRVVFTTEEAVAERATTYHGCIYTRTDSSVRRIEDLSGRRFAFSDETSTSGHIFPRMLLDRRNIRLGRVYYAGGHPNVIQAVWDGKADGGSGFYSPPGRKQIEEGSLVGDARFLIIRRMPEPERRRKLIEEVRVLALTDPIPNDLCAVRSGFPEDKWDRFEASFRRFIATEEGREAYFDLLAGVAVASADDSAYDGFRTALDAAGMSADKLLEAEERKLEERRKQEEASSE